MSETLEEAVIGHLLSNPADMNLCHDLQPDDFVEHGSAYEIMRTHFGKFDNLSLALLKPALVAVGYDTLTLANLKAINGSFSDIQYLKSGLKSLSGKRKVIEMSQRLKDMATDASYSYNDCMEYLHQSKVDIAPTLQSVSQAEVLQKLRDSLTKTDFSPTGLSALDKLMAGGMYKGRVYGVSGRAKSGKTMLALTIAYNLAASGIKHTYLALEMGSEELNQRLFARQMKHNTMAYLSKNRNYDGIKTSADIRFVDSPGASWNELHTAMISELIHIKPDGFIIDYWQLIEGRENGMSEEYHLRTVAQSIANFAKKHNVWILLFSQTNEDGKTFAGRGLEKACDQLYFIENAENESDKHLRWLKMHATRYTEQKDHGSAKSPSLEISKIVGPYFVECISNHIGD